MTTKQQDPVLVVVQLSGGNDYLNTVIPHSDENYYDNRPTIRYADEDILRVDDDLAFNPQMGALKDLYDEGNMAVIHGVGWENSTRSHFRAMDIWHTAEPDVVGTEGWLGRAIRELDPAGDNPVTAVNVGYGLPRALLAPNASVASVSDLEGIWDAQLRRRTGAARGASAAIRKHVRTGDRHRPSDGVHWKHGTRCPEGRRHVEGRAGAVLVQR